MRVRNRYLILFAALLAISLWTILSRKPTAAPEAVSVTVVGYTNPPGNALRFALISLSNQAPFSIRWHGDWVEVEGVPDHKARTINSRLPGFRYEPVLRPGESLKMAVGEPSDAAEGARWRFVMAFSRYTWRERWLDFSFRHRVPSKVGAFVLADSQRLLNPSNRLAASTAWLAK